MATESGRPLTQFKPDIHFVPFPIGVSRGVFAEDFYENLIATYPPPELFRRTVRGKDDRYTLNDIGQRDRFRGWIGQHAHWREFYDWVRDSRFVQSVFAALAARGVELGVGGQELSFYRQARQALGDVVKRRRVPRLPRFLHTRFEFAMLPGHGGYFKPHTDASNTILTLVITMVRPGEWNETWGGALEICRPTDPEKVFNWVNHYTEFESVECVHKFPYVPNQCMFFIKTYDSWHCIRPMTAPTEANAMRRTVTVVIERD